MKPEQLKQPLCEQLLPWGRMKFKIQDSELKVQVEFTAAIQAATQVSK